MPYRRRGNKVLHEKGGKWVVKQTCSSPENAKKAIRLLNAKDHGWEPDKSKKERK